MRQLLNLGGLATRFLFICLFVTTLYLLIKIIDRKKIERSLKKEIAQLYAKKRALRTNVYERKIWQIVEKIVFLQLDFGIAPMGDGQISISASTLNAGMCLYSLVVDDRVVDTKRMILTK